MINKKLKLAELLPIVRNRMKQLNKEEFVRYANELKKCGDYNVYTVRLANDVKRALFNFYEICEWYNKYDCHDNHITSLFTKVLKEYIKENQLAIVL